MDISKKHKIIFTIRNLEVFAKRDTTDNLELEVYPKPQGLVGLCYSNKMMYHDDNLAFTNDRDYNLSQSQIFKTKDLKFCLVCPIFNSDNEVISILAFDSKQEIKLNDPDVQEAVENSVLNFSQLLHARVPDYLRK